MYASSRSVRKSDYTRGECGANFRQYTSRRQRVDIAVAHAVRRAIDVKKCDVSTLSQSKTPQLVRHRLSLLSRFRAVIAMLVHKIKLKIGLFD